MCENHDDGRKSIYFSTGIQEASGVTKSIATAFSSILREWSLASGNLVKIRWTGRDRRIDVSNSEALSYPPKSAKAFANHSNFGASGAFGCFLLQHVVVVRLIITSLGSTAHQSSSLFKSHVTLLRLHGRHCWGWCRMSTERTKLSHGEGSTALLWR